MVLIQRGHPLEIVLDRVVRQLEINAAVQVVFLIYEKTIFIHS
jgi:hypothetical protein